MNQGRIYTMLELHVFRLIMDHIENSEQFQVDAIKLKGGIFTKPRPKQVRLDLIELNTSGLQLNNRTNVIGHININYQHDDIDMVHLKQPIILDLMDYTILDGYLFTPVRNEIFRISKYLWWGNCFYDVAKL